MPTNSNRLTDTLAGFDAEMAALPMNKRIRGGEPNAGVSGLGNVTSNGNLKGALDRGTPYATSEAEGRDFSGLGELLEADDVTVFKAIDDLVIRQELLAISRLHQDRHWTNVKLGLTWSELTKDKETNRYRQAFPPGMEGSLRTASVPNKQADLCNKLTETLLVDPPKPSPQPENDSERAQRGAQMAKEFLTQDGTEAGTADADVFWAQIEGATTRASTFNHYWLDPTGGGSIPQQIKAHPDATDSTHPLDAIDPATGQSVPTTDYILRYVTADGQFTDDPSQAARQWLPKIRIEKWGREHWRLFPEDQDLHGSQSAVGLLYCSLGEARRRWPSVAAMDESEIQSLFGWYPRRYLALLPLSLRARWLRTMGQATDPKGGSHDERLLFYYAYYRKSEPDYPKGCAIFVSGAQAGTVLGKDTLTADVQVPSEHAQDELVTDTKHLDIPLVQIRLIQDPDEKDPTGRAFMARIGGAGEAAATLVSAFQEAVDIVLHPARFATSTSPITEDDVEESRSMGSFASVLSSEDYPKYEEPRALPPGFINFVDWTYEQMDSAGSQNKPSQGSDQSQEVSGVARKIAVNQAMVAMSRMQQAVIHAFERHWRIKLQLAMKGFTVPQLLRYVGEDGASKQEWFTGNDFATVGGITMLAGTGTMMPPAEKVSYIAQLQQIGLMEADEAADAARPAFTTALGIPDNPHQQRIERQVSSWLEGPPAGWVEQYKAYVQAKQAFDQQQAAQQPPQPAPDSPEAKFQQFTQQIATDAVNAAVQLVAKVVEQKDFGTAPPSGNGPDPKAEAAQVDLQAKVQSHQAQLQMAREKHQQDLRMAAEKHQQELALAASKPTAAPAGPTGMKLGEKPGGPEKGTAPPIIHVHPAQAPVVHMDAPIVNVAPSTAPQVTVQHHGKRTITIRKNPDGSMTGETNEAT